MLNLINLYKSKLSRLNKHSSFGKIFKSFPLSLLLIVFMVSVDVKGVAGAEAEDPMKDTYSGASVYASKVANTVSKNTRASALLSALVGGTTKEPPEKEKKGSPIETEKDPLKIRPLERKQDFHAFIPKKAFVDMIDSKEWEKMYDNAVSGSSSSSGSSEGAVSMIGAVTWGLANSAVGQARYNAIMQTQSALLSHYMAELAFLKQIDMNPYMKESVSDAYFSCVRKQIQKTENSGSGAAPDSSGGKTWFEAQEICMGDDSGTGLSESEGGNDGKIFTFADSYDFNKDTGGENGGTICLTDYLFYQEKESNSSGSSSSDIENLQKEYKQFIGDIAFMVGDNESTSYDSSIDANVTTKAGAGVRKMKYKVIYPGDTKADKCKASNVKEDYEPRNFLKKLIVHRYQKLADALYGYCEKLSQSSSSSESSNDSYWEKEKEEFLAYFSNPDFQMSEFAAQALFDLYEYYDGSGQSSTTSGGIKIDCSNLEALKGVSESDIESYSEGSGTASSGSSGSKAMSAPYKVVYYYLAANIAKIDMIMFYTNFHSWINVISSTNTGADNFLKNIAQSQIDAVLFKTFGNIQDEYLSAVNAIKFIMTNVSNWENANQSAFFSVIEGTDSINENSLDAMTGQ